MKLKKLLSFALALAMVLAFIPAMSLTASAAETTNVTATNTFTYNVDYSYIEDYPAIKNQRGGSARQGYAVFAIPEEMQNADAIEMAISVTMKERIGGFYAKTVKVSYLLLDDEATSLVTDATTALNYIASAQTYTTASTIYVDSAVGGTDTSDTFTVVPNGAKSVIVLINYEDPYTNNSGGVFYNATESNAPVLALTPKVAADVAVTYENASGEVLGTSTDTAYVDDSYQPVKEDSAPDGYSLITFDAPVNGVYGYIAEVISGNDAETIEGTTVERTVVIAPIYKLVSDNIVTNGGFETGDFTNWTNKDDTTAAIDSNFVLSTGTDNVSEGKYALSTLAVTSGSAYSIKNTATVPSDGDGFYYIAVDLKGTTSTGHQYLWMTAGDDSYYSYKGSSDSTGTGQTYVTEGEYITASYLTNTLAEGDEISLQGSWFGDGRPYIDNFVAYRVEEAASETSVTVEYVDSTSGETIDSEEVTGLFSGSKYTPTVSGTYYDYVGDDGTGYLYTYGTPEAITLATSNNVAQVPLIRYKKITANLVENGDFSDGLTGWGSDEINPDEFTVNSDGALAYNGTAWSSRALNGIGGTASFQKSIAVESGKEYYYSIDVYQNNGGTFMSYAFTDGTALASDDDQAINGKAYILDGCESDIVYENTYTREVSSSNAKFASSYIGSWHTFANFVTATNQTKAFEFDIYYFCDSAAGQVDNVKFYELAPLDQVAITFDKQISGISVGTETKYYNAGDEYSESFAERVNADGDVSRTGNYLYTGASTGTATADGAVVVELTQVANADVNGLAEGGVYDDNGTPYLIKSGNLIPNGDMALGKTGYTTGVNADVTISDGFDLVEDADGNYITANAGTGVYKASSILGGYDVENGKTYLLTVDVMNGYGATHDNGSNWLQYGTYNTSYPHRGSLSNGLAINDDVADTFETSYNIITSDSLVMELSFRWISGVSLKNFGLYEIEKADLGVELLNGAQIRIGNGVDDENRLLTESGLRFIATVDTANKLAGVDGAVVGIAISADDVFDANADTLVAADKYQEDASVFTVAVTNIKASNYNTVYYAIPYVHIGDEYYTGASVARTPYQVAAGILVANDGDGTLSDDDDVDYTQTSVENDALYAVLNAYVNVTGARITLDSEYKVGYATYANGADEFFTYSDAVDNGDGTYTITLTAIGNATFYDYADEYYRINNAKEDKIKASADIDDITTVINGSTMEITFTPATTAAAE